MATALLLSSCGNSGKQEAQQPQEPQESTVYMTTDISAEGLVKIFKAMGVTPEGNVAVKISTGEPGGNNFLKPELIKDLVSSVNGTIVECNTAYAGRRNTSEEHWKTVKEHGFLDIAPFDLLDEDGEIQIPVKDTTHIKYNIVGKNIEKYNFMINLAHFKGHAMGGFGGVLKNQSIGLASSNGKAYIHSAGKTAYKDSIWQYVKQTEQDHFIEAMAVAAQSVHDYFDGKILYINVMNNLSVDCDCSSHPADPEMKDIGILASTDPVALDKACVDLIFDYPSTTDDNAQPLIERINEKHGVHIIDYAEKLGLGTTKYTIKKID
ncbi:MAG: DUF362 domain-containing protein [Bacteroidales bacterium]|nr:DUF362 domain-containing protein [Bacteroidales bacterium]